MSSIACAPENDPPIDLVTVGDGAPQDRIDEARAVCLACPVLMRCSPLVKRLDVAGVAAGLTRGERIAWQERHGVHPESASLLDVTPARQITAAMLDDLPASVGGEIHPRVRDLVLRMTKAGMSADQIVDRLGREDITHRTVNYLRRTYMKGWARVSDIA